MKIKRSMLRLWKKQLKKYYNDTEDHLVCLTCTTIILNNLKKKGVIL